MYIKSNCEEKVGTGVTKSLGLAPTWNKIGMESSAGKDDLLCQTCTHTRTPFIGKYL